MKLTPAQLRAYEDELIARVSAREHLAAWIRYRDIGLTPALHHELIIRELEAVERGEVTRLMLQLPPGSAKSTYTSVEFPPWFIGRNPKASIIAASHTLDLAERFGRKARNIVASREFKNVFDFTISDDSQAAGKWETTTGAEYFAVGVGGSVTGRRADCLLGNTLISTYNGDIRIDEAKVGQYVLAQHEHRPAYCRIVAVARRKATEYWRIHTAAGNVVEATGNHRIRVGAVWREASSIVVGDVLVRSVRTELGSSGLRTFKEVEGGQQLSPSMLSKLRNSNEQLCARFPVVQPVPELRLSYWRQEQDVLCKVPFGPAENTGNECANGARATVRHLRQGLSTDNEHLPFSNMLDGVQEQVAVDHPESRAQSRMEGRSYSAAQPGQDSEGVSFGQASRIPAGLELRCVSVDRESGSTPHQSQPNGQQAGKSREAMQEVPYGASCGPQEQVTVDFVSMVERIRCPEGVDVYDIEVEQAHNFFANGILVHNCGIIDDPVKGREDADSERSRETVWQWYLNDFLTRLKPGARQIVIMTRWHELDLAGMILSREASKWRVVSLPMICDSDVDPLGRKIGDRLWPDWFTDEMVQDAMKDVRSWNALYQQNPVPDEGSFFKKDWFIEYSDGELPSTLHRYGTSDFAVTDKGGDFTEHAVWGVDFGGDIWLLDWWSGQTAPDVWIDEMCRLIGTHKPLTWFGEAGPIRRSIEPFLRKRMDERRTHCNIEWLPSIMDKATRARPFQALASMGKVKVPRDKPWFAHVFAQWLQFPAGRLDDAVDAASLMGRGLEFTRSARRHEALRYPDLAIP